MEEKAEEGAISGAHRRGERSWSRRAGVPESLLASSCWSAKRKANSSPSPSYRSSRLCRQQQLGAVNVGARVRDFFSPLCSCQVGGI